MTRRRKVVHIPIGESPYEDRRVELDADDPGFRFDPASYLSMALAYDSMAAPKTARDRSGIAFPDYNRMLPRLALQWTQTADGDWDVVLRPAKSNRGNIYVADDVVWRFERAFSDRTPESFGNRTLGAWRWQEVVGVVSVLAISRDTVRFSLRSPNEHFPNWLFSNTPNVFDSRAICDSAADDDSWGLAWRRTHVAGFGAYDFKGEHSGEICFDEQANYWAPRPGADSVVLRRVESRAQALEMLDTEDATVLVGSYPDELRSLMRRADLEVDRVWAGHCSVEINFEQAPFNRKSIRHALAFATPYQELRQTGLLGLARPWQSPVKRVSQWYDPTAWNYGPNVGHARELMVAAGYRDGFSTELYVPAHRPDAVRLAEILRDAWRWIGVDLELLPLSSMPPGQVPPLYLRLECCHNMSEPVYDVVHDYAAIDDILDSPPGTRGVANWLPRFARNEEAIEMIRGVLEEQDPTGRRSRFARLQAWLVDFSSSIFIAEQQQALVWTPRVPPEFVDPNARFFQAMMYQNTMAEMYLPSRLA